VTSCPEAEKGCCVVTAINVPPGVEIEESWCVKACIEFCGVSPNVETEARSCVVEALKVPPSGVSGRVFSDFEPEERSCVVEAMEMSPGVEAEGRSCVVNVVGVSSGFQIEEEGSWRVKTCRGSCDMLPGAKTEEGLSDVEVDVSSEFSSSILEGERGAVD